ncbi:hypothetical protein [Undibacterium pigrum]|uniref:Uncharacterized protein n=1 Tax=Undibacterium pigrum TaxID=401470 RepID=A0A318IQL0_9BURK|nr:hypothetical protein [Undibacterium pigrum]PXX34924.1 hypothetical protein DFR42_1243 [Undibacterium pigrum]
MTSRALPKLGVCLFLLAVIWYFAGNSLLKQQKKSQLAHIVSSHKTDQQFSVDGAGKLVLKKSETNFRTDGIRVVFDPDVSQVTVHNGNNGLSVNADFSDGIATIDLGRGVMPARSAFGGIEIRLPTSISQLEFAGVEGVEISAQVPLPEMDLQLSMKECAQKVNVQSLRVRRLKLASECQGMDKNYLPMFALDGPIRVNTLEVQMPSGALHVTEDTDAEAALLRLGKNVLLTARTQFFEKARFQGRQSKS